MPESKGRRRGRPRSSRPRRTGGATTPSASHASARPAASRWRPRVRPRMWRRVRRWAFIGVVGGLALVFVVGFALPALRTGQSTGSGSGEEVGESVSIMPLLFPPANHLSKGETFSDYSTTPATSGPHWSQVGPNAPVGCGIYGDDLLDEQTTHNLEHGHIVISHNLKGQEEIEQLKAVAEDLPGRRQWLVLRPYSKIAEGEVAITAWGWLQRFQGVDATGLQEFYSAHFGNGPEFAPC